MTLDFVSDWRINVIGTMTAEMEKMKSVVQLIRVFQRLPVGLLAPRLPEFVMQINIRINHVFKMIIVLGIDDVDLGISMVVGIVLMSELL